MMDFAVLPPETNSARMYSGPGSAPMRATAAAWNNLAAEMRSTTASYDSVISGLTSGSWLGPASTSMAAAATPYAAWMKTTAAQAEQTAAQAQAAANAYESAFAMTVPPQVIAANRAQLAALVATNILGQNTPAIAATETQYGEMWAQDAAAMYGYAGSSATASQLTPFTTPQPTTTTGAETGQAAAVAQATGTSATNASTTLPGLTSELEGITAPGSNTVTTGLAGLLNDLDGSNGNPMGQMLDSGLLTNISNGFTTNGELNPTGFIDTATAFSYLYATQDGGLGSAAAAGLGPAAFAMGPAGLPGLGSFGSAVSAGMGQASQLGGALSVPPSWPAIAPTTSPIVPPLGGTPLSASSATSAGGRVGMPGMPIGGMTGLVDHDVDDLPMYGFRPKVMAHPPAAG